MGSGRVFVESIPQFDLKEIDGKVLTMAVHEDKLSGITLLCGIDVLTGTIYVLCEERELHS